MGRGVLLHPRVEKSLPPRPEPLPSAEPGCHSDLSLKREPYFEAGSQGAPSQQLLPDEGAGEPKRWWRQRQMSEQRDLRRRARRVEGLKV